MLLMLRIDDILMKMFFIYIIHKQIKLIYIYKKMMRIQADSNLEDMKLEELHDRLVDIEKDNEQIRRENQLFESYITRKMKEKEKEPGYTDQSMSQ